MEGLRRTNESIVEKHDGSLSSPPDKDWDGDLNIQEDLWELDYMFGLK
jgi:hypothetical protein